MRLFTVEWCLGQLAAVLGITASSTLDITILEVESRKQFNLRGAFMIPSPGANEENDPQSFEPPMPAPNPAWKWLSPTEEALLRAVRPSPEWKTAEILASEAGLPCDRDLKAILRNMVDRNLLESMTGRGYCLKT